MEQAMSEEKPDKKTSIEYAKPVSLEQGNKVTNFINEKSGGAESDKCVVCGSPNNNVLGYEHAMPLAQTEQLLGLGSYSPTYVTACNNCGFLRFFSKNIVDKALATIPNDEGQ